MNSLSTTDATFTGIKTSENDTHENSYLNSTLMEGNAKENISEHTPIFLSEENSEEPLLQDAFFIIATTVCIAGFLGNIATLAFILMKKKHKVPTYTGIFCLSLADTPSLVLRYFIICPLVFSSIMSFQYIYVISLFTNFSSCFYVVIIAFIRYIYICKPFYSLTFTCRKVLFLSTGVWIASLVVSILCTFHLYFVEEIYVSLAQSYIFELVLYCVGFLATVIPVSIFHVLNIVQLRKGLSKSTASFSKSMAAMLATVIVIYLLAYIPAIVVYAFYFSNTYIRAEIVTSIYILLMLIQSTNPFVYFLLSDTVKKSLRAFGSFSCFRN